jgi:hypothetical protein
MKKFNALKKKKRKLVGFREWCEKENLSSNQSQGHHKHRPIVEWGGRIWTDRDWT